MVVVALSATIPTIPARGDWPCTNEQPYPSNGWSVCTGYGQQCARVVCAYPPGTPGHWDVNGRYEPRMG